MPFRPSNTKPAEASPAVVTEEEQASGPSGGAHKASPRELSEAPAGRATASNGGKGATPPPDSKDHPEDNKKGPLGFLRELPFLLLVAFLLALLVKTFLIQAFYIPSGSMEPTLDIGDRVLVNKVVYRLHEPRRGDVIVFEEPHPVDQPRRSAISSLWHWVVEGLGVSSNPDKDFIKRVIALPGETIEIDRRGNVFINGRKLKEPYLSPIKDMRGPYGPHRVAKDSLFVMGDNRGNSNDSRFTLGDVPEDKVVGRAFTVIWPPSRVRWLRS